MNNKTIKSILAGIVIASIVAPYSAVLAAPVGQGFEISPPVKQVKVNPGQTVNTTITLRNITGIPINAHAVANDFTAKNFTGEPSVLVDGSDETVTGMRAWFAPIADQVVAPSQLVTINVRIDVPRNASPGGHYAVLRFSSGTAKTEGGNGVALTASVGTLFLLTVSGDVKHSLLGDGFSVMDSKGAKGNWFQQGNLIFTEKIQNKGNVHEQPTGQLVITNMFGKNIAKLPVNEGKGNILPTSERQFEQSYKNNLFGFYTTRVYLSYADGRQLDMPTLHFTVIPVSAILILALVIIVLVLIIKYFRVVPRRKGKK